MQQASHLNCGFFPIHRSHSISFTRDQGVPKYKIGFGRGEGMGELGKDWLRGMGVTMPVTGGGGNNQAWPLL
jgi:hypothetical protein